MTDRDVSFFDDLYERSPDPWGFDDRWYERRKFALTLAALPDERFERAVEAGCANGALTKLLAARCDELYAFDFAESAIERATQRLSDQPHVHVINARFPDYWPHGGGDLVVWSEIVYYLASPSAEVALNGLERWLRPDGVLVAVHYTGTTDYPKDGAEVGTWLDGVDWLSRLVTVADPSFEIGVWRRSAVTSFALEP